MEARPVYMPTAATPPNTLAAAGGAVPARSSPEAERRKCQTTRCLRRTDSNWGRDGLERILQNYGKARQRQQELKSAAEISEGETARRNPVDIIQHRDVRQETVVKHLRDHPAALDDQKPGNGQPASRWDRPTQTEWRRLPPPPAVCEDLEEPQFGSGEAPFPRTETPQGPREADDITSIKTRHRKCVRESSKLSIRHSLAAQTGPASRRREW